MRRQRERQVGKTSTLHVQLTFFVHFFFRFCTTKGDITRDDSQRPFLAQHSVAMLEQCCNPFETMSQKCCNAVLR